MSTPLTSPNANNGHGHGAGAGDRSKVGRRSLFAFYPDQEQTEESGGSERPGAAGAGGGRRALFSGPRRRRGTITIECSHCDARTPLSPPRLLTHMVPSFWVPGLSLRWWMHCPACNDRCVCHLDKSSLLKAG